MSSFIRTPLGPFSSADTSMARASHEFLPADDTDARRAALLRHLRSGEPILFDGPAATLLYERGVFINRSFDEVNVTSPELLRNVHSQYLFAGAQVLSTNTWGANSCKLQSYGLAERARDINVAGARLAREVAGGRAWVAGVIGPLGVRIEPWGPTSFDEAKDVFREQAVALLEGGADLLMLQTFGDLNEIQQAIRAVRELGDAAGSSPIPIVAMMSTNDEGHSLYGTELEWFIRKLEEWGADVVGVNGGNGPAPMLELAKRIKAVATRPVILSPNAGLPRMVDGRLIYMASPEYLGEFARQAMLQGVQVLSGCSGTTPAHIAGMHGAIRQGRAFHSTEVTQHAQQNLAPTPAEGAKAAPSSHWAKKLAAGEFAICLELLPPKGLDTEKLLERSRICKNNGIDAINIPDGPRASARMSALASAVMIERDVGIETILHYACRDRNLLGIQSDLLGAAGLGLKNILCVTGDPPKMGPYPTATAVYDIDSIGLVNMATRLNSGFDLGGSSIGRSTNLSVGVGANPVAPEMPRELERFRYKVEAGAAWAITQPVFETDSLFRFLDYASRFRIPVIAGVWPLTSLRNAEFMANEVPGVVIPKGILERMARAGTAEAQKEEGLAIAAELIDKIRSSVQGLQLSAPLGQVDFALRLLK